MKLFDIARKIGKVFVPITFVMVLSITLVPRVSALSQADYDAIYNGWVDWVGQSCSATTASAPVINGDNIQTGFDFFVANGLTAAQSAAIIGNFMQESGMDPNSVQQNGPGRGIAQWSVDGRWQGVLTLAQQQDKPPTDLGVQLDFVWQELKSDYASALAALQATSDVVTATQVFEKDYEAAGDPVMANRIMYAQQILAMYGNTASAVTTSYSSNTNCATETSSTVNCSQSSGSSSASNSTLSQTRQNIICIAQHQLQLWEGQPGYPNPSYSLTGYFDYSQNRIEEWCADFVSWVYNQAGYPLQPDPDWNVSAVAEIQSIGQQNKNFHWHPQASGYTPVPGDLAIHTGPGVSHVNIFISYSGGVASYIGGDQGNGPYPGGSIVSTETGQGYYANDIVGYVSPD